MMTPHAAMTVVFAGGGTGGHLSPGIAIAESLAEQAPTVQRIFACSNREIDARMLADAGEAFVPMPAAPFAARPRGLLRFAAGWRATQREMAALLRRHNVRAVVALGGFVAAPVVRAAAKRGVPAILINLDAVPGKANRLAGRWCDQIISTCDTPAFPRFSRRRIAMPLRRAALAPGPREQCRRQLELDADRRTLLVTGASQGSQSLNDLLCAILRGHREWLEGWQVIHLTGHGRDAEITAAYREAQLPAVVRAFEKEIGRCWGAADLALSRAGANSVAEVAANAVPTVFLPYPFHRDQHQRENALPLCSGGGCIVIEDHVDSAANLAAHSTLFEEMLRDGGRIRAMRTAMESNRPLNGADEAAAIVREMLECPASRGAGRQAPTR